MPDISHILYLNKVIIIIKHVNLWEKKKSTLIKKGHTRWCLDIKQNKIREKVAQKNKAGNFSFFFFEKEIKMCDMFLSFPDVKCSLKQSLHLITDINQARNRHIHLVLMFINKQNQNHKPNEARNPPRSEQ